MRRGDTQRDAEGKNEGGREVVTPGKCSSGEEKNTEPGGRGGEEDGEGDKAE